MKSFYRWASYGFVVMASYLNLHHDSDATFVLVMGIWLWLLMKDEQ